MPINVPQREAATIVATHIAPETPTTHSLTTQVPHIPHVHPFHSREKFPARLPIGLPIMPIFCLIERKMRGPRFLCSLD